MMDIEAFKAENSYSYARVLPDGRILAVAEMTFGNYRLVIGTEQLLLDGY
jgi:hypothetical protein